MQEVHSINTGEVTHEEAYDGEYVMSAEGVEKYLGQNISSDSTNTEKKSLRNKVIGIQN